MNGDDTISGVEEGQQAADFLNGGDGDDHLLLGAGDFATGGANHDEFVLQDGLSKIRSRRFPITTRARTSGHCL